MPTLIRIAIGAAATAAACHAGAQLVNYNDSMSAYRDLRDGGVKLIDGVTPAVSARASVARAIAKDQLVEQSALVQPDGTLKLPPNQTNLVIRTDYSNVTRAADGTIRVASPTIQGNVNGNVTLYVDGQGIESITVLNNGR